MIYLLHSTVPLGGTGTHSARHYMGYTPDAGWRKRIDAHRAGTSHVKIIEAFLAVKGQLLLVAVLPGGTRTDERHLKAMGHMARLCPLCQGKQRIGWPGGLVSIIPRRTASTRPSARPPKETGGDSPHRNSTLQTILDGASPLDLPLVSSTMYGAEQRAWETGGTSWTVTAPPSSPDATSSAGTRPVSSSVTNGSEERQDES
jgi:hypothetical protein